MINRLLLQLALAAVALTAAFLAAAAAVFFLSAALYLYLATLTAPPIAALATGLADIVALFFILFAAYLLSGMMRAASSRKAARRLVGETPLEGAAPPAQSVQDLLAIAFARFLQRHPTTTVLASLGAGLVVGLSPKLRKTLRDLLRN